MAELLYVTSPERSDIHLEAARFRQRGHKHNGVLAFVSRVAVAFVILTGSERLSQFENIFKKI